VRFLLVLITWVYHIARIKKRKRVPTLLQASHMTYCLPPLACTRDGSRSESGLKMRTGD